MSQQRYADGLSAVACYFEPLQRSWEAKAQRCRDSPVQQRGKRQPPANQQPAQPPSPACRPDKPGAAQPSQACNATEAMKPEN
ncbi:hypothetical protein AK812_SmicGene2660 [Symbiodinium microadriaticum]|uniref:Uncharacterized protein n=1 Tax=Symbiodinium microadriaticum TaxID=2951 RepID=A0A1Q9F0T0_SYMMI|nr:hypothetical protein AK812_SmicGene2660 [Symbiodinium microadriaticum]